MQLEVVTPKGAQVSQRVDEVTIPGGRGEYGILPGHTPLLTTLRPGILTWKDGGTITKLVIGAGVAEVSGDDRVIILANESKKPSEIDAADATRALDDAQAAIYAYAPPVPTGDEEAAAAPTGPTRDDLENRRLFAQACVDIKHSAAH